MPTPGLKRRPSVLAIAWGGDGRSYVVIKVSVFLVQSVGALKSILTGHFDCLKIRLSAKNMLRKIDFLTLRFTLEFIPDSNLAITQGITGSK